MPRDWVPDSVDVRFLSSLCPRFSLFPQVDLNPTQFSGSVDAAVCRYVRSFLAYVSPLFTLFSPSPVESHYLGKLEYRCAHCYALHILHWLSECLTS